MTPGHIQMKVRFIFSAYNKIEKINFTHRGRVSYRRSWIPYADNGRYVRLCTIGGVGCLLHLHRMIGKSKIVLPHFLLPGAVLNHLALS